MRVKDEILGEKVNEIRRYQGAKYESVDSAQAGDIVAVTGLQHSQAGQGFGGKEDMAVQHHAALLAYHTGKPVKVRLTRKESIMIHPKRHPAWMEFTTACDENGYLTGMTAKVITDTGAYASLGGPVLQRLCTHAAGPYNLSLIHI